jgi:hypothetical protein
VPVKEEDNGSYKYVPRHLPFQKFVGEYLFDTRSKAIDEESGEQTVYAEALDAG